MNTQNTENQVVEATNEKVFELLENTGLNWSVDKRELFDAFGNVTNSFGIFKTTSSDWLGTVGSKYTPLQNWELANILIEAGRGLDIEFSRGGSLNGDTKIYLQAALPDQVIGRSNVKRNLTGLNSHDGSSAVGFGSTNTVVVCQNTFYKAYGELQKFRHTASMKERIEIAQKDLRKALGFEDNLMTSYKKMADMPLKDEAIERVIRKIFNVQANTAQAEISTRKKNQVQDFANSLQTSITEQGTTIWALFNGVTRYTNHILTANKENGEKLGSIMAGTGNRISNVGFNEIMKFIEENEATKFAVTK